VLIIRRGSSQHFQIKGSPLVIRQVGLSSLIVDGVDFFLVEEESRDSREQVSRESKEQIK
jgi:hypothetical protein